MTPPPRAKLLASRLSRRLALAAIVVSCCASVGCMGVQSRESTLRNITRDHLDRIETKLACCGSTKRLLHERGLSIHHAEQSALRLEAELTAKPDPAGALALAELWYRAGLSCGHGGSLEALTAFRNAAAAAALAIRDPSSPEVDHAVEVHNEAVARLLRVSDDMSTKLGTGWSDLATASDIVFASEDSWLSSSKLKRLEPTEDFYVRGMRNCYKGKGLGVPTVGLRPADRKNPTEPTEVYFPPKLRVCATVVAIPGGRSRTGAGEPLPSP